MREVEIPRDHDAQPDHVLVVGEDELFQGIHVAARRGCDHRPPPVLV